MLVVLCVLEEAADGNVNITLQNIEYVSNGWDLKGFSQRR